MPAKEETGGLPLGRPPKSRPPDAESARETAKETFLASLRQNPSVTVALSAAGVGRRTCYEWRLKDKRFSDAWTRAQAEGVARLEQTAVDRAVNGWTEPFNAGRDKTTGEPIIKERPIYDNRLLEFLLRAHGGPEYQPRRQDQAQPVSIQVQIVAPGQLPQPAGGDADALDLDASPDPPAVGFDGGETGGEGVS